jgi:ABC-type lipoprotein export system ATPase subunit
MTISLKNIIPIPLRDKPQLQQSEIWNRQVDFNNGEWIKIKAPSGTGKTTLVHIIWQLRADFTGKVLYDSTDAATIEAATIAQYRQEKMSVIFQDMRLFANLTAFENIELKRTMHATPFYDTAKIFEMAELLGVNHILQQKAATCSYGEQQRITIIRALMQSFKWLIMDEPFSHLDKENTTKAAALIAGECKKRKAGFILTDLDDDSHFNYSKQFVL